MSQVIEHLADLTGYRDRDVLDVTLVGALRDLLRPQSAAIYRCVGDESEQRWVTRARLELGDTTAKSDPLWAEPDTLPPLDAFPERHACLQRQEAFTIDGSPSMSFFPITSDREPVGVLELRTNAALSYEDVRMVCSILRIYRNFQGLLDYSERDTLTGLLNRKTFDDGFLRVSAQLPQPALDPRAETHRAVPVGGGWLGLIDIDHFKRVNDLHGHLIGDEVLLLLSRLMRSTFRFNDHLYRFGGEEFVVLMRCGSREDASQAFERLRVNVQNYAFPQVGRITVSIGFTELRASDTPSAAFQRADRAVYHVKENGRNRIAHHATLVEAGLIGDESQNNRDAELF
jgi:diguanylate cyclase (GGDEF)-like protein